MTDAINGAENERSLGPLLQIADSFWDELTTELHRRGHQRRETGAFLLAGKASQSAWSAQEVASVIRIVYYDDLDASCLTGGISLAGYAYDELWRICREDSLRVVADVHTHPGSRVDQSGIDSANPMMALSGHVAIIVGRYAEKPTSIEEVGVHLYLGNREWRRLDSQVAISISGSDLRGTSGRLRSLFNRVAGLVARKERL